MEEGWERDREGERGREGGRGRHGAYAREREREREGGREGDDTCITLPAARRAAVLVPSL